MNATPAIALRESDQLVCRLCWGDVFVGESRGRYVLMDATPSATGAYIYVGPGRFAPRFAPAADVSSATPAEAWRGSAHWLRCRELASQYLAEARSWLAAPDVRARKAADSS